MSKEHKEMKKVQLFTDGACSGNPGPGAWCFILKYMEAEKVQSQFYEYNTNNQMELLAVIEGIKVLKVPVEIDLYSDSQYVIRGINEWLPGWIKTNFKGKKNIELWKEYLEVSKIHKINAFWVKAHNGHTENERCDSIAYNLSQAGKI